MFLFVFPLKRTHFNILLRTQRNEMEKRKEKIKAFINKILKVCT